MDEEGRYLRVCRRCNEFYRTDSKRSKYCNKCRKPTYHKKPLPENYELKWVMTNPRRY